MWKVVLLGVLGLAIVVFGLGLIDASAGDDIRVSAQLLNIPTDIAGFARAEGPYTWQFPADFGPHPAFQTEWWYYTGNLADRTGRRFGYQFTIFRRAITPEAVDSDSEWRTNQIYLAHFTVTDVEADRFYQQQRFSRGAAGLAGATSDPRYHVWLEDWEAVALDDEAARTRLTVAAEAVAIDLTLEQIRPPALQGEGGLSRKSDEPGNASYYYSLTRLLTVGTITVGGTAYAVSGTTWMDHEFSTGALGDDAQGWDWFGLHLDDGRDLMLGRIRRVSGGHDPAFGGLLVWPNGRTRQLRADDFTIDVTDTWTSPHTGAVYPAGWRIHVDGGEGGPLDLTLTPLAADQELRETIAYWEGAVHITGETTGYGYAELTGYAGTMNGRF